jgi:hypothetical protein
MLNVSSCTGEFTEVMTMTRNQWTWLLVAATLILAAGVLAKLFWPMSTP